MTRTEIAIRARGLRKAYRVYAHAIDPLVEVIRRVPRHTERVALQAVDLDLKRGEIVGILGRNGAGKSTLLKIIAGTLERSSGDLEVNGRITAILELGTGFHPDYTGRENIFMGGLCLGMPKAEIERKLDSIVDFSELQDVIDQPFKTYSTGMQARLTFATAISVEPDILIVDEALSVGDARFQMKCFGWIQRLKQNNATILLVSHDTNTITTFCDRALILEGGRVFAEGEAGPISVIYHNLLFGKPEAATGIEPEAAPPPELENSISQVAVESAGASEPPGEDVAPKLRYGTGEGRLLHWGIFDEHGRRATLLNSGGSYRFSMRLRCDADIAALSCGFAIKDRRGTVVWGATNLTSQGVPWQARAGDVLTIACDCKMWLAAGDFFLTLGAAHLHDGAKIDFVEDAIQFRVVGTHGAFTTALVNLESEIVISSEREDVARVSGAVGGC
ncbi:ABC transporter ATP-binding protein [Bradyrhizobium sp. 182]|uniref:ABC transporter ATP-binding protein n=1 Tax=unclassified Bradyrhizobium TaxID=2631580 RepID=UPI001FF8576D|nr:MULTISPECIES: ABC transporter ATP-binding protein [unclassified Bradyrhizobium]MCK1422386.1 ABC transporter ATP-binding protein [Bradyrhizobium sp. CW12]MCK1527899.1 ABC transporter ATP-binding protein [Bradyrhizobium sp. 182]MCK1649068.1 ABC transporter ATP-binding protein [Bradyrhizobium sp. 154]